MKNKKLTGLSLALLISGASTAHAQTPANPAQRWGSWFIATVQLPGTTGHKWGGYAEVQVRTDAVFRRYFYNEVKAGVSYDIDPNFTVLVGTGRYTTSDYQALAR